MQIQQIKFLTWVGALVAGGALAWEVYDFLDRREELVKAVPDSEFERVLKDEVVEPEPPVENRVTVDEIVKVFFNLEWTGKKVVEPVAQVVDAGPKKEPVVPVSSLLEVRVVQVSSEPEDSVVFVAYTNKELKTLHPLLHGLKVGDHLSGKHKNVRVDDITIDGALFAFDDETREKEMVEVGSFTTDRTRIVVVDSGGAIMPINEPLIAPASPGFVPYNPKRTQLRRPNEFDVGTLDVEELGKDYSRILSEDVTYRAATNPRNGQAIGLQITRVRPDSLPARHGLSEGEILKSINGHPVRTVQGAVAFVKKESATTTVWTAVFEKQGREFTRTYRSP